MRHQPAKEPFLSITGSVFLFMLLLGLGGVIFTATTDTASLKQTIDTSARSVYCSVQQARGKDGTNCHEPLALTGSPAPSHQETPRESFDVPLPRPNTQPLAVHAETHTTGVDPTTASLLHISGATLEIVEELVNRSERSTAGRADRDSGSSSGGSSINTSNFVTRSLLTAQTDATHNSISDSLGNLSSGLKESVVTDLLTVTGGGSVTGALSIGTSTAHEALTLDGVAYFAEIVAPSVTSDRLYNVGGDLYWSGNVVGGGSVGNWATDGTDVWRVSGNVGIGTSTPSTRLAVTGQVNSPDWFHGISVRNKTVGGAGMTFGNVIRPGQGLLIGDQVHDSGVGNYSYVSVAGTNSHSLRLNAGIDPNTGDTGFLDLNRFGNSAAMVRMGTTTMQRDLYVDGNVGIGTNSPNSTFEVWGDVRVGTSSIPALLVDTSLGAVAIGSTTIRSPGITDLYIFDEGDARLTVEGIGKPTIAALNDAGHKSEISLFKSSTTPGAKWNGIPQEDLSFYYGNGANVALVNAGPGDTFLTTDNQPRMTITHDGNVGIGTTSPNLFNYQNSPSVLSISNDDSDRSVIEINGSRSIEGVAVASLGFGNYGNQIAGIDARRRGADDAGSLAFYTNPGTGNELVMEISETGNIGIGTTTPSRKLTVAGTAAFTGLSNDGTGYYACVNVSSGELSTSTTACGASSERFKENIEALTYGIDTVNDLRPVSFDWKDNYLQNGAPQIGFIAEEVASTVPEVIGYSDDGKILEFKN